MRKSSLAFLFVPPKDKNEREVMATGNGLLQPSFLRLKEEKTSSHFVGQQSSGWLPSHSEQLFHWSLKTATYASVI